MTARRLPIRFFTDGTPQTIPMLSNAIDSLNPQIVPFVRRSGTIPQDVSKKFLVYMEQGNNEPLKAMFDVREVRQIGNGDGSLFAPPRGYLQDRTPEY